MAILSNENQHTDFYEKIDHSLKQAEEGKVTLQGENESVDDFLNRLLCNE